MKKSKHLIFQQYRLLCEALRSFRVKNRNGELNPIDLCLIIEIRAAMRIMSRTAAISSIQATERVKAKEPPSDTPLWLWSFLHWLA